MFVNYFLNTFSLYLVDVVKEFQGRVPPLGRDRRDIGLLDDERIVVWQLPSACSIDELFSYMRHRSASERNPGLHLSPLINFIDINCSINDSEEMYCFVCVVTREVGGRQR